MINNIHPGILLLIIGALAAIVPSALRKIILVVGPALVFTLTFFMPIGTSISMSIVNNRTLYLMEVTKENKAFLFVFALMALMGGIYAAHNKSRLEAIASMSYAGAALGVTLAADWISLILFWELMAVTSLFLIWAAHTQESRKAGFRYLLLHMLGGNLLLAGIFLKAAQGEYLVSSLTGAHDAAFWLIFIGIGINAAIVPLHAWVPDAYPQGTITGSVFLSSFTTKLSVLCLIRVFAGTEMLIVFGIIMIFYGACYAMIENDIRRLLSYHIISQLGFMVADVGIGTHHAIDAATALAFSNVLYKSLLFMCAGAIIYATGIKKINQLGGLAKKMPIVCIFFFIAALSIAGVPGLAGFTCKTLSVHAAEEAGLVIVEQLMRLGSLGTALSIPYKMGYFIFFGKDKHLTVKPIPKNMYLAMGIAAACCILFGVCPQLIYEMLPYTLHYQPYTVSHVLEYIALLGGALLSFIMYLKKMEPHTALSLDLDWFYRKPLKAVMNGVSVVCVRVSEFFGGIGKKLYLHVTAVTSATFRENRMDAGKRNAEIGEGVIEILLAVVVIFVIVVLKIVM